GAAGRHSPLPGQGPRGSVRLAGRLLGRPRGSPAAGLPRRRAAVGAVRAPVSAPATVIDLSYWQVGVALVLDAVVIVISIRQSLGLERGLALGGRRTIVQLS